MSVEKQVDVNKWRINKKDDAKYSEYRDKIVTRFPPEPSGYLHLGHVKAIFINWVIAKRYGGQMIFRYDDTNPVNETEEYELAILEDVKSLGVNPDRVSHTSDYFEMLLGLADKLVEDGLAYVDDTDPDVMSHERKNKIPSRNRDTKVDINRDLWTQMKNGQKQDAVLRLKLDIQNDNAAMRDPSIYRFVDLKHHRSGEKFRVFPSYDFACPIVDSIEGVTHVFRSCEFANRDEQCTAILKLLDMRVPILHTYGRINFQDVVMSKRKIKALVNEGKLEGWHDPRLMTIRGARRHGLHHDALVDFIARMGFAKSTINMTQTAVWSINRKVVDKISTRYTGLVKDNVVEVTVSGEIFDVKDIPRFRRNPQLGNRPLYYSNRLLLDKQVADSLVDGEEITLMNWGNCFVSRDEDGKIHLTTHLEGDFKKTEKKVMWLAVRDDKPQTTIVVRTYDGVDDPIVTTTYLTENGVSEVLTGEHIELLARCYLICDSPNNFVVVPTR